MNWFKLAEEIAPSIGVLFIIAWFIKILNYSIFDYYQNSLGRVGSLLIGTFTYYKRDEIANETNSNKRISKVVNNICGYILLGILAMLIIFIIMILN